MSSADEKALSHAWAYFTLHAQQRITVFNYFVVFAGVLSTGLAAAMQASPSVAFIGVALGILLALLSFIFWALDQRTSFLIKHAEQHIARLEPPNAALIGSEQSATDSEKARTRWHLSYGTSLRVIFLVMAVVGCAGSLLSGLRAAGVLEWNSGTKGATARARSIEGDASSNISSASIVDPNAAGTLPKTPPVRTEGTPPALSQNEVNAQPTATAPSNAAGGLPRN